jgi:hypothetical protein
MERYHKNKKYREKTSEIIENKIEVERILYESDLDSLKEYYQNIKNYTEWGDDFYE